MSLFSDEYERIYERVSCVPQQKDEKRLKLFLDLVPQTQKMRILDLGCAEGKLAIKLAEKGHDVFAVDISQGFLEQVRQSAEKNSVRISIIKCDIENDISPLKDIRFDYIFFMDVLEHLRSPIKGLENICKLMSNESVLIIYTPNACTLNNLIINIVKRKNITDFRNPEKIGNLHLQEYESLSLQRLCAFAGLEVIKIIPTRVTLPFTKGRSSVRLARLFPSISDSLLFMCRKCDCVDFEKIVESMRSRICKD